MMEMDDTWLNALFNDAEGPSGERGNGTLRQRGGGASAHRAGAPVVLATTLPKDKFAPEPTDESAGSCVPPNFEWITTVKPPPRLKRSRKSEAHDVSDEAILDSFAYDAYDSASADTTTTSLGNPLDPNALSDATLDGETLALANSFTAAFDFGGSSGNDSPRPAAAASSRRASSSRRSTPSGSRRSNARPAVAPPVAAGPIKADVDMDAQMPPPPPGPPPPGPPPPGIPPPEAFHPAFSPEMATFGVSALAPVDQAAAASEAGSGGAAAPEDKKARHNLTERKRITRMNELFDRLSAAIEQPEKPLLLGDLHEPSAADAEAGMDPSNPAKPKERSGASKAKVLEGALRCIRDLQHKLAEERLARTLLSVTDLDAMASSCSVADSSEGSQESHDAAKLQRTESDYKDVAW